MARLVGSKAKKTNKLQALVEQTKQLKKKMQEDGQEALKVSFKEFFQAHPEAKAIVWAQYTPYFNDGDACTFGVNDFELKVHPGSLGEELAKVLSDDVDYGYGEGCAAYVLSKLEDNKQNQHAVSMGWSALAKAGIELRPLTKKERSLVDDFDALSSGCHEISEVLEMVLGDHVQVTATEHGFETEEHSHD